RETVAGSGGHDAERHVAERQRRRHLVDRAVAAPRHHRTHASRDRVASEIAGLAGAIGDEDLGVDARARGDRARDLGARPPGPAAGPTRNRIDDDGYRRARRLTVPSFTSVSSMTSAAIFATR